MISRHSPTPQPSPIEQLLIASGAFAHLPLAATKEELEVHFDLVRSLLLQVTVGSI